MRVVRTLPWVVIVVALAAVWAGCPGTDGEGRNLPRSLAQNVVTIAALLSIIGAVVFTVIHAFVASYLPLNGWQPIRGDVFAWYPRWFMFGRHEIIVASWREACAVLRARLAGLGYSGVPAVTAGVGRYTTTTVLVHPESAAFAAITLTIDPAPRLQLAFVSFLEDGRLLVTATDVEKSGLPNARDALPIAPGALVQVLDDGLPPGSLLGEHTRTVAWLGRERRATVDELATALAAAATARRRAFLARPVRSMMLAFWRGTVRRHRPDRGELRSRLAA